MATETQDKPKTRTRTRRAAGTKEQAQAKEQEATQGQAQAEKDEKEQKRAEREAEQQAKKGQREAEAAQKKAERQAERDAAKAEKEAESQAKRQELIDSGDLIEVGENGTVEIEFVATEPKKDQVAQRAREVIERLKEEATEVPMPGKELADEFGGGTVQWVAFFGMLRMLGLVRVYRFKTGERGNSGLAYLWVGPVEDEVEETEATS